MTGDCAFAFDGEAATTEGRSDGTTAEPGADPNGDSGAAGAGGTAVVDAVGRGTEPLDCEWTCPHESHPEADYCVFHLDPETRRELGITDRDVRDAFLDAAAGTGRRCKEFVGANLGDLDLRERVLDTDDRFAVDCRHTTIGHLQLAGAVLQQPLVLDGATIERIDATETTLTDRLSAIDCRVAGGVRIDEIDCEGQVDVTGAIFEGPVSARASDIDGHLEMGNARFEGEVTFERTTARSSLSFESATIDGEATFDELACEGDAVFADATFAEPASFAGAEFRGGSNLLVDDADFAGATFEASVDFEMARFRYACFDDVTVQGEATLDAIDCLRGGEFVALTVEGPASMASARFEGRTSFERANFHDGLVADETVFDDDVRFAGVEVMGKASFSGVEFRGGANVEVDDADFSGATVEGKLGFKHAHFRRGTFEDLRVDGTTVFDDATVERGASFTGAVFDGEFRCFRAQFGGKTTFDGVFCGTMGLGETVFDDDASFADLHVRGEADFRGVEFRGGANVVVDDADFSDATFEGPATFRDARFRHGRFDGARFAVPPTFDLATFRKGAEFDGAVFPTGTSFSGVTVQAGLTLRPAPDEEPVVVSLDGAQFHQGVLAAGSRVRFDLTEATIGEVRLTGGDSRGDGTALFERFRFNNTEFEGFDFSRHRQYLERNRWQIHTVDVPDDGGIDGAGGRSSGSNAAWDDTLTPQELEATYLKAKNGAKAVGDNKAASEFFIREMGYRRSQYEQVLAGAGDAALSRPRAASKWLVNAFFGSTCGYGERPFRVVVVSTILIGVFAVPFALLGIEMPSGQVADPLVYSLQSFTSLVLDPPRGSNAAVNVLTALEGFIGGFFIALFVFALTRSLHR